MSHTQINLTWAYTPNNETGFKVLRSGTANGTYTTLATLGASARSYPNTGLTASTPYYYQVCATNATGDSGYASASATTQAAPPPPPPPGSNTDPTNLVASAVSARRIDLTWSDNSSNEIGFRVERSLRESGRFSTIARVRAGVTSYSNVGLRSSTTYYYRVRAYNRTGFSGYSNVASAATLGRDGSQKPATPSGLEASAVSPTRVDLKWSDNSSDETGFKIERSSNETGPFSVIMTLGPGATSYSNTDLTESTTYFYRLCAYNRAGYSAYSGVASASTPVGSDDGGGDDDEDVDGDIDD